MRLRDARWQQYSGEHDDLSADRNILKSRRVSPKPGGNNIPADGNNIPADGNSIPPVAMIFHSRARTFDR